MTSCGPGIADTSGTFWDPGMPFQTFLAAARRRLWRGLRPMSGMRSRRLEERLSRGKLAFRPSTRSAKRLYSQLNCQRCCLCLSLLYARDVR